MGIELVKRIYRDTTEGDFSRDFVQSHEEHQKRAAVELAELSLGVFQDWTSPFYAVFPSSLFPFPVFARLN